MKVYLAARYSRKNEIKRYADELRRAGIIVTSSWLEEPHASNIGMSDLSPEDHGKYARTDLRDVWKSDYLVFFAEKEMTPRGGRHVEFGYALGSHIPILVVGPHENIFHYLPEIDHFDEWEHAKRELINIRTSIVDSTLKPKTFDE